ncbi:hypothetical protein OXYTRIMIC_091 [Oxytricha trifallax]|uniref:Uncharacterized protein n=1 Tax=Oxytricha trifallax TaxID=1172189 RepID=A0A073HYX5_9SPIT|nr:hypothetical protein OXYTRIMIC_091 [Oxytricha trifallax]
MRCLPAQDRMLQYLLPQKHSQRGKRSKTRHLQHIQYLKRSEVMVAAVPQIEGLTADDFLDYAKNKPSLLSYLPDQSDWLHLDKKWICDVLLSLDKEGINLMVLEAKQKRRERLDQSQNLIVHMKPEFVQALNNSLSYSGKQYCLIKSYSSKGKICSFNQDDISKKEEER